MEEPVNAMDLRVVEAPEGGLFVDFCGQKGCNMTGCACFADHDLSTMRTVVGARRETFLAVLFQLGEQAAYEIAHGL